jgi:dTDP-4-amino-4,6-dideoxygalactose transaminase
MSEKRIYLSPPSMNSLDRVALNRAYDSGWIAPLGPEVEGFEKKLSSYLGVDNAVALSSGTAGLHLALLAIGIKPGDRVIVPTLTFAATAFAVKYTSAVPIFIDSDLTSWTIDTTLLENYLETVDVSPKAIISVDIFGRPSNFDELRRISSKYGVPLISDSAESLGAIYDNKPVGSQALISIFSFNGNKIISTSGGGMLVSNDFEIASRVRYLATQAREDVHWYEHSEIGFNYRLSNLLAALGNSQLDRLNETIELRRRIQERYTTNFAQEADLEIVTNPKWGKSNYWITNLKINNARSEIARNSIKEALDLKEIESRFVWKPMHLQPIFRDSESVLNHNSETIYNSALCLPTGTDLSPADVDRISYFVIKTMKTIK